MAASQMLLEEYRSEFPITRNLIWLNHAAIAPLVRPAAEAMMRFSEDSRDFSSLHYDEWLETYEGLRRATARLINSKPGEIALLKNTSEGLATVAMGLNWRTGDTIVAFREEFPANQYPWQRLEAQGVLTSEWREEEKRNKRFYRLSRDGAGLLAELVDEWRAINTSLNRLI